MKTAPGPEQTEHRIENGATTPEQRAFIALEDAVHPADFLGEVQGQAAEYRAELGMSTGIPHVSLLATSERIELRADVVSTISSSPASDPGEHFGEIAGGLHLRVPRGVHPLSSRRQCQLSHC